MKNPQWKTVLLEVGYNYINPATGTTYYASVYNNTSYEYTVKITRDMSQVIAVEKHIKSLNEAKRIALEIIRRYVAKENSNERIY